MHDHATTESLMCLPPAHVIGHTCGGTVGGSSIGTIKFRFGSSMFKHERFHILAQQGVDRTAKAFSLSTE